MTSGVGGGGALGTIEQTDGVGVSEMINIIYVHINNPSVDSLKWKLVKHLIQS